MKFQLAASSLLLLQGAAAQAAFTDFSDYTQSQTYATGEVFQSQGVSFRAGDIRPATPNFNSVQVFVSGSHTVLQPGPGVEFLLPPGANEVSMKYQDGAGSLIAINGVEPNYPPVLPETSGPKGFGYLSGQSLAGVLISTSITVDDLGYQAGTLTLRGPLNSLVIGGLELSLDDVSVLVPEPSAAVLLWAGVAVLFAARRRTLR